MREVLKMSGRRGGISRRNVCEATERDVKPEKYAGIDTMVDEYCRRPETGAQPELDT